MYYYDKELYYIDSLTEIRKIMPTRIPRFTDRTDLTDKTDNGAKTRYVLKEERGLLKIIHAFLYYCNPVCLPRFVRQVRPVCQVRKSRENRKKTMKCHCIIAIKHYIITITGKKL